MVLARCVVKRAHNVAADIGAVRVVLHLDSEIENTVMRNQNDR
jgi:hypothetical protein